MVKLVFCLRRLETLSPEEFDAYWVDRHGPLVRSVAHVLGIRRYVQLHRRLGPAAQALATSRGAPDAYDGVAELWFDSEEGILASTQTEEGLRAALALLSDERRFIDLPRSPIFLYTEHDVV